MSRSAIVTGAGSAIVTQFPVLLHLKVFYDYPFVTPGITQTHRHYDEFFPEKINKDKFSSNL